MNAAGKTRLQVREAPQPYAAEASDEKHAEARSHDGGRQPLPAVNGRSNNPSGKADESALTLTSNFLVKSKKLDVRFSEAQRHAEMVTLQFRASALQWLRHVDDLPVTNR